MSVMTLLRGVSALSPFRIEKLLQKAQKIGLPETQLSSQYWYFVSSAAPLHADTVQKLQALLVAECVANPIDNQDNLFLITPRIGTISPWASKATDIAHNCGLQDIERIERGMAVTLSGSLNSEQRQKWADLLHDRMTESVLSDFQATEKLFSQHNQQTFETIDVLNGGKSVLEQANQNMGLALSPDEIDYLIENYQNLNRNPTDVELMMFAQANSEH
ncbi:MAG: phosphoribosylformylglycinamidine synthase, partial [Alysiella sp.]|nr:phosphoribosylformylglycinamidine synthase [Alysiella sp.]